MSELDLFKILIVIALDAQTTGQRKEKTRVAADERKIWTKQR